LDETARVEYNIACNDTSGSSSPETNIGLVYVELIDKCSRGLKFGKSSGPDGLCAESLLNAHPKVVTLTCALFRSMLLHNYVPMSLVKVLSFH